MSVILTSGNPGLKPVYPKIPGSGPAQADVSGFFTLPPDGSPQRTDLSQILYMFLSPKEIGNKQKIVLIGQNPKGMEFARVRLGHFQRGLIEANSGGV